MSQTKAVILTYIGMCVLTVITCLILGAVHADGTAWGLAVCLLAGLGGFLLSLVMMHFPSPHRRRH